MIKPRRKCVCVISLQIHMVGEVDNCVYIPNKTSVGVVNGQSYIKLRGEDYPFKVSMREGEKCTIGYLLGVFLLPFPPKISETRLFLLNVTLKIINEGSV